MTVTPVQLEGKRIIITGPTSQVALPLVEQLAKSAEVFALARYSNPEDKQLIESLGATPVQADLADHTTLANCPSDVDYVINMAVVKTGKFDYDMAANAEGVGNLMMHCRTAKGFLHISTGGVYQYAGHEPLTESAELGDNHRAFFPTYSISKIAAETVCRFVAHQTGLPTTIARLSVPYGDTGGWPFMHLQLMKQGMPIDVHPEGPNLYNLLHQDDYIAKMPYLLAAATPEVTTTNFGGSQIVSIEEWCAYLAELTGFQPEFRDNPMAFGSLPLDTTRMHQLIGETQVNWKDGIKRMVETLAPELLRG